MRGRKKAWTYFADGYAVFLLFLALSGLFMIPGRKGLFGREGLKAVAVDAVRLVAELLIARTALKVFVENGEMGQQPVQGYQRQAGQ